MLLFLNSHNSTNILIAIGLLIISLATIIAVRTSQKIMIGCNAATLLTDLVFYFIYVKLILHYVIPAILRLFSDFQFEIIDNVKPLSVLIIYIIEFISWSVWLTVFVFLCVLAKKKSNRTDINTYLLNNIKLSKIIMTVISMGFILTLVLSLIRVDFPGEIEVFKSLFYYCGLTVGPIFIVLSKRILNKFYFYLGIILCGFGLLAIPTRGALVYMLLFFIFLVWRLRVARRIKIILAGVSISLISFYFIFGSLMSGAIAVDENGSLSFDLSTSSEKSGSRTAIEEIEWRFGASTRMGTAFLSMYDRNMRAGILPIKHSLLGIIPRSLNPDKPIPSTVDPDDIYSQGMYLIYREINGYDTYSMTEFPTGAHFYWEFGLLGVVLLSAVSAFYISVCSIVFSNYGIFGFTLMIATFKPWGYMDPKIWVSDVIMQIYQVIFPAILLILIIRVVVYILHNLRKVVSSLIYRNQTNLV